jgi:Mrp family chromosome partitioning ATPase
MEKCVVSAGVSAYRELTLEQAGEATEARVLREVRSWSPERFAQEQLRGLIRQVFFSGSTPPVRQVVFCAVDSETEVASICRAAGEALAEETSASIAVVTGVLDGLPEPGFPESRRALANTSEAKNSEVAMIRTPAPQTRSNLSLLTHASLSKGNGQHSGSAAASSACLADLRREFEYSLVEAPAAGESSGAAALGRIADGIVLVIAANRTRRATARYIKETLDAAHVRLLGVILNERTFPVPAQLYQWL